MTPSQAPPFDPRPRDPRLANFLKAYPGRLFSEPLYQSIELMERYSIDLAIDVLARLGVIEQLHDWRSSLDLCERLSFQPRFHFALEWLLRRLIETGCLEARLQDSTRCYKVQRSPWPPELAGLREIGLEIDAGNAPTLDLLDKAASLYPAVARSEQNAEAALFAADGIPLWLNYFSNENLTYAVNNWVAAVEAASHFDPQRRLHILELGAGAGSASEILLRCLANRGLLSQIERYVVTEPNAFFLRRAQRQLSKQYPAAPFEWRALDMNLPWADQGVRAAEFDLIYGVNVLHVAKDLSFTLSEAGQTLKGTGWLVIGECVRPYLEQPIYVELIFQLLDSFIDVQTDSEFRPHPGFLTPEQWRRVFAGFSRVEVQPDIEQIRELYPHFFTGAIGGQMRS